MDLINWENLPLQTTPLNKTMLKQFQDNINNGKVDKTLTTLNAVDLNTVKETGFYYCSSCSNIPSGASNGYLDVLRLSDSYVLQKYYKYDGVGSFERKCVRGTWENWIEIPYEINGTWIPKINTRNNIAPTATYTSQTGTYKKIGNMVFIAFYLRGKITALNDTNNYGAISGLPFAPKTYSTGQCALTIGQIYNVGNITNTPTMYLRNEYDGLIWLQNNNGSGALVLQLSGSSDFQVGGSGWYEIA